MAKDGTLGGKVATVVEPGSADDPFTANVKPATTPDPVTTDNAADASASKPDEPDSTGAPDINALVDAKVKALIPDLQRGWDRVNTALKNQVENLNTKLEQQATAQVKAEREARAQGLAPEEIAVLKTSWQAEDKLALAEKQLKAVDEYRLSVEALNLIGKYEPYGLTPDQLEGIETPEEMEAIALRTKVAFLENGGKVVQVAGKKAPAAQAAQSDVGGAPASPEGFKVGTERGTQALKQNVSDLFKQPGQFR